MYPVSYELLKQLLNIDSNISKILDTRKIYRSLYQESDELS